MGKVCAIDHLSSIYFFTRAHMAHEDVPLCTVKEIKRTFVVRLNHEKKSPACTCCAHIFLYTKISFLNASLNRRKNFMAFKLNLILWIFSVLLERFASSVQNEIVKLREFDGHGRSFEVETVAPLSLLTKCFLFFPPSVTYIFNCSIPRFECNSVAVLNNYIVKNIAQVENRHNGLQFHRIH